MAAGQSGSDKVIALPLSAEDQAIGTDAHTRTRWRWLDQIMADCDLTPFAFCVGYVIASHVNRESGEAWPSQATIAEKVSSSDRGVRKVIDQLAENGHLSISTPEGRKGGNRYRLILKGAAELVVFHRNGGSGKDGFHRNGGSAETELHRRHGSDKKRFDRNGGAYEDNVHRNGGFGKDGFHRNGGSDLTGTVVPPIPLNEPFESISSPQAALIGSKPINTKSRAMKPKADESGFDELWQMYPRKVGKDAARKSYAAAIGRRALHADIMAGLRRYVAGRAGKDPAFTAHPASWLNAGRWTDEEPLAPGVRSPTDPVAFEARGVPVPESNCLRRLEAWRRGEPWPEAWGSPPDQPGCSAPAHLIERVGIARRRPARPFTTGAEALPMEIPVTALDDA